MIKPKKNRVLLDYLVYVNTLSFLYRRALDMEGIYVGIDIDFGSKVYWNPSSTITSHVFIVGPSGSGKSVTLSAISYRVIEKFKPLLTIFDVKNEYRYLFKIFNLNINEFSPLKTPLPLCFCDDNKVGVERNVNAFLKALSKVYGISPSLRRALYENIKYICSRCEPIEHLYDVAEDSEALNDAMKVFEVYPSKELDPMKGLLSGYSIINLREAFLNSTALSSFLIYYIIDNILKSHKLSFSNVPQRVIVLDELWHIAPYIMDDLIQILTRYSRGYGVSLFMATQNIDDVEPYTDVITTSSALLLAMASPTHGYWGKVARYLNLSRKGIDRAVELNNQGECVMRMYPYEDPMFIYVDPLDV